jgi:hypothetical protein
MERSGLERAIADLIVQGDYGPRDVGKVIKAVMGRYGDVTTGQAVREIAEQKLAQRA